MKIVCDSCGAKYSIADEKVAGKIFKIRCKKCSSVLEVRGDQAGAHPSADASEPQDSGGEATWYIVVDGEQKGPLRPIELSQLFAKGAVGLDSYVWKESFDDWKVASDVPELAQIFGGSNAGARQGAGTGHDDTSAFGTGGDLFSEGGREPTSEIDTNSSMFAGFDEAPTPTESEGSPLAAAAGAPEDEGAALGGLGGGMAAAAPQKMTGQRNENSVLFSLSNLQQLASRGGAAASPSPSVSQPQAQAAAGAQPGPQVAGEGSGLIDIRALAKSTTPGTKTAPSQAVDDLLAIGTGGGGGTLGAPLLGPAPLETSEGNRWIWIAGAAIAVIAIVGAGVGVGMALGGSDDDALEIAPVAQNQEPADPAQRPSEVAAANPAPEEPVQEAAVVDIEPEQPVAAATLEEPKPTQKRATPKKRSSSSTQRKQRTAERSRPPPAPKRKSNNLDALMDEVVGGSSSSSKPKQTSQRSASSGSNLPDAPSRNDVKTALQGVSGAVKACRKDSGGTATVNVTFSGKTGRATGAKVASGPFKGTSVGTCIQNAVKRARVPRFKQSSFKVTFPYRL
jgi:predicted Zn finger-like uncharacterized protein